MVATRQGMTVSKQPKETKALSRDPAELSYKEWMALPADEQNEVPETLRQREGAQRARRAAGGRGARSLHAEFWTLMQEVREEEQRTGIIKPGWIVIGKGRTLHRLTRKVSPDMLRDVSRRPRRKSSP